VSARAAELSRLYGDGLLYRTVAATRWRFRWCYRTGPLAGVVIDLRLGGTRAVVGIESLGPFDLGADVLRSELPPQLLPAYLGGAGALLWQELEAITGLAVEVLDVKPDATLEVTAECLGFEISREPSGRTALGVLCFSDPDEQDNVQLQRALVEASRRQMTPVPLPVTAEHRWAAVVGSTNLPLSEVQALEEQDVILIDDAAHVANALSCWLAVGPTSRYAGRATVRDRTLLLAEFGIRGKNGMTSSQTDMTTAPGETRFEDIPVSLRFELAQWNASMDELAKLAAGAVIDLGRPIDEHSVSVWMEQRCIGKGQLVAIGERLGVRLVSVFAGHRADETELATVQKPSGRSP
jgi:type III secretion protein Q